MHAERNPRPPAPVRFDALRDEIAARATTAAYREHGPIRKPLVEEWAQRAYEIAAEILAGGWPCLDAALTFAARLDETAELAWHLSTKRAA